MLHHAVVMIFVPTKILAGNGNLPPSRKVMVSTMPKVKKIEEYKWKPEYEGLPLTEGVFAFIVNGEKKFLVCQRGHDAPTFPGYFNLPGGGRKKNQTGTGEMVFTESRLECCFREVWEETGIDVENNKVNVNYIDIPLFLYNPSRGSVDVASCYMIELLEDVELKTSAESINFAWVDGESIAENGRKFVCGKDSMCPGRTPLMMAFGLAAIANGEVPVNFDNIPFPIVQDGQLIAIR
ncbi:MAG: NUDIX hydrolase [Deltaproteobacteria bacterium]|jgi:8-oxo-dGTP pyrophosphatase MutT (NUDIX family)|nr:NUDIX hydrolase [Deltaproteobacteria bacterium]